jgi:hypothetical protein
MPRRPRIQHSKHNAAGCVQQRVARSTGTLVGIYDALAAGMESDPALPWATVCEVHNNLVCHPSLRLAKANAPYPAEWCQECVDLKKVSDQ